MITSPRILIVVTSHAQLGSSGRPTGLWLEELAVPYQIFVGAGASVDIASPRGGRPPIDPKSEDSSSPEVRAFLADAGVQRKLDETSALSAVTGDYDAWFIAGGHGVMWDLPDHERLHARLAAAYDGGKVVAAVCHGPAALVGVRLKSGQPLVAGRRVSGFSDEEEAAVGLTEVVPFLLEQRLKELGGKYERGPSWKPFAVTDGRLVTGQNPASSAAVAQQVLALLNAPAS